MGFSKPPSVRLVKSVCIVKSSVVDVDGFSPVEWKHKGKTDARSFDAVVREAIRGQASDKGFESPDR